MLRLACDCQILCSFSVIFVQLKEAEGANDVAAMNALFPAINFNGGGHLNHTIFWTNMAPNAGGEPSGPISEAINKDFGSFQGFKASFYLINLFCIIKLNFII